MTDERELPSGDDNWDDLADFLGAEGAKDQFSGNDEDEDTELVEDDELDSDSTSDDSPVDAVEVAIDKEGVDVSEDADWAADDNDDDSDDDSEEQEEEVGDWVVLAEQLGIETGELEDELESVDDEVLDTDQLVGESLEEDTDETDGGELPEDGPGDTAEVGEDTERLTAGEGEGLDKEPESAIDEAVAEIARLFGSDEEEEAKTDEGDDNADADPESEEPSAKPRGRRRRSRRGRRPDAVKAENGDQGNGESSDKSSDKSSEEAEPEDKKRRRGRRGGRRRGDKATDDQAPAEQGEESGDTDQAATRKATRNITTWKDVVGVIVDGNIAADRKSQKPRGKRRSK